MKKRITVAITGHRDIIETEEIEKAVSLFFEALIEESQEIILLSPLADGADRFVAKIFLKLQKEYSHLRLVVPMPFSKERYMLDFDEASKVEFEELLTQADGNFKIPSFGDQPYRGLGKYMVSVSDYLLALWDGTYNGKAGGTGDVVEYATWMDFAELVHIRCERQGSN